MHSEEEPKGTAKSNGGKFLLNRSLSPHWKMQGNRDLGNQEFGLVLTKVCLGSNEIDRDSVELSRDWEKHCNLLIFSD